MERATNPAGCRAFARDRDEPDNVISPWLPTGLADGLASVGYTVIRPRFAPGPPWFPRSTGWSPRGFGGANLSPFPLDNLFFKGPWGLPPSLVRDAQTSIIRQGHRPADPHDGDVVPPRPRLRRVHRRAARRRRAGPDGRD